MYEMMVFRDSLRRDARKLSKKATITERTGIKDHSRRLEGRIKDFHRKADTLMDMEDLEDLTPVDVRTTHELSSGSVPTQDKP